MCATSTLSDAASPSTAAGSSVAAAWLIMAVAILLEVCGTTSMKMAGKHAAWYVATYSSYAASLALFPFALKRIPLSIAYAVWSGSGTALTVVAGTVLFKERLTLPMLASIVVIIAGVVSLNYFAGVAESGASSGPQPSAGAQSTSTLSNATDPALLDQRFDGGGRGGELQLDQAGDDGGGV